jgi:hypothetical protein
MKLNNSDNYESITVILSKEKNPIAWEQRVLSNMNSGATREEAEVLASEPIEVEMYYDINSGLFLVESEIADWGSVYNPYSGELLDDADAEE